jgi:hypothetical protein
MVFFWLAGCLLFHRVLVWFFSGTAFSVQKECGASLCDLVKVIFFLADIKTFPEMNDAYLEVMGSDPSAHITVDGAESARGEL